MLRLVQFLVGIAICWLSNGSRADELLPDCKPLLDQGDIASEMVAGIDQFLLEQIKGSITERQQYWHRDLSEAGAYSRSIETNRTALAHMLGVRDQRLPVLDLEYQSSTAHSSRLGGNAVFEVHLVRWQVLDGVYGEGLLLTPVAGESVMDVIVLPDADQTPEQITGLQPGVPDAMQYARQLAEQRCRVVVPTLISRDLQRRAPKGMPGRAELSNREFVYRPAFELGRHVLGYEIQKALGLVDWFSGTGKGRPIVIAGYGEGGAIALYSAALDPRISATYVAGYFGPREQVWTQPIDRNVFGLLKQFGDAELATMVYPRDLIVDYTPGPVVELKGNGGAPASLSPVSPTDAQAELLRAVNLLELDVGALAESQLVGAQGHGAYIGYAEVQSISPQSRTHDRPLQVDLLVGLVNPQIELSPIELWEELPDPLIRQQRQVEQLQTFNQSLLMESHAVRSDFWAQRNISSVEAYEESVQEYRKVFREKIIGQFDLPLLPPDPKARQSWETEKWTGHEVKLDVFPGVFAYGVLLVPKGIKPGEQRPVVVCQHGLEGRPTDVFEGDHRAYHDFAAKLCERGFITFAPQNIYLFGDRFRTLQRKANAVGTTLFSVMVPQHQQIVNWLKTLPFVDSERIAFYGLSYGGKSAMRIPALVDDYCLSICSADFNEWVLKNASTKDAFSYVWTNEYEIFEFDLANTFNYAEMAALICPRPFMVERGHFDGVGVDEWVAFEYAKVRHLYQAELQIGGRTEIEWFIGPHTINGKGTFEFLQRHLEYPTDATSAE